MGIITIKPEANKSEEVADFLLFLIRENRIEFPKLSLFQLLLAKTRPGLSSELISSSIISRFDEAGIPKGPLVGGAPNVMENFTKIIAEEFVSAIQDDMRVDIAVDTGITVQASGANAGGPVVAIGSSIAPHTGIGVAS